MRVITTCRVVLELVWRSRVLCVSFFCVGEFVCVGLFAEADTPAQLFRILKGRPKHNFTLPPFLASPSSVRKHLKEGQSFVVKVSPDPYCSPWHSMEIAAQSRPWVFEKGGRLPFVMSTHEALAALKLFKGEEPPQHKSRVLVVPTWTDNRGNGGSFDSCMRWGREAEREVLIKRSSATCAEEARFMEISE